MPQNNAHEDLTRQEEVKGSSNRSFGVVFTVVFLLIALFPLLYGRAPRLWALGVSGMLLVVAFLLPALLTLPNRLWLRFGLLLNSVVSPVAMGVLFLGSSRCSRRGHACLDGRIENRCALCLLTRTLNEQ